MSIAAKQTASFPGGLHPPDSKSLTEALQIQPGPPVKELAVFLGQHIGAPTQPTVKKGDAVEAGQLIGECQAFVCAPVHSPVKGKVKEVGLRSHPVFGRSSAIVIEAEDAEPPAGPAFQRPGDFKATDYTPEQIVEAVREAGLVGMGGAGFPTSVKIQPDPKTPREAIIINGCECEPYITCDYRIMLEWTEQIVTGIQLIQQACGASKAFIAVENNKPKAIEQFNATLGALGLADRITVMPLATKYPQGGERQLIQSVLAKTVPTGGIPPMIGVVVTNVATAAATAEAVCQGRPLTHRVVTVTGEGIARCGNFYVAVGTPVAALIEHCGGINSEPTRVVLGGPMTGPTLADLTTPVTKASGAVTVLTKDQIGKAKFKQRQTACIRCGRCLEVCPEKLNPTKIAHAVKNHLLDVAERYYISACIECGCCSYVCPANIELTGYIKTGKIFLARQKKKMPS